MGNLQAGILPGAVGDLDIDLLGREAIAHFDLLCQQDIGIEGIVIETPYGQRFTGLAQEPVGDGILEVFGTEQPQGQPDNQHEPEDQIEYGTGSVCSWHHNATIIHLSIIGVCSAVAKPVALRMGAQRPECGARASNENTNI